MCPDERAFLDAVLASPDDDLPRLVYADWLEERRRGDRAAMIRRGITSGGEWRADNMSRLLPSGNGLGVHSRYLTDRWTRRNIGFPPQGFIGYVRAAMPRPAPLRRCEVVVRRGFVCDLVVPWEWWRDNGNDVVDRCPVRQHNAGTAKEPIWVPGTGGLVRLTDSPLDTTYPVFWQNPGGTYRCERWPGVRFGLPAPYYPNGMTAVRNAFQAAEATGGGTIWLPPGVYDDRAEPVPADCCPAQETMAMTITDGAGNVLPSGTATTGGR
jgi:uncharacterized protein (TIGR02996 family)